MNVRLFKPSVGEAELQMIREAFERSWIGLGPMVNEFEDAWKDFTGSRTAVGVNSATAALHLALALFRFPEGKKVLVPSLTFAATATAVLYNRLIPVFVDSDPVTLCMDLEDLERKYDRDCVAVIPVHYAGHPVPMEQLMPWARERGLKVVGGTLTPVGGSAFFRPEVETARQALNRWIRHTIAFDAVVDFDALLRDPAVPTSIRPDWTSDALHPSDDGYQVMAQGLLETLDQEALAGPMH